MKEITAVIGYPVRKYRNARQVLLAIKQNKLAIGLRMPYGGKVEPGETYEEAMIRELSEESEMITELDELEDVGTLFVRYYRDNRPFQLWKIKMFLIHGWTGVPTDTREMKDPRWFTFYNTRRHDLPLSLIPEGDRLLTFKILLGKKLDLRVDCNIEDMALRCPPHIFFEVNRLARAK